MSDVAIRKRRGMATLGHGGRAALRALWSDKLVLACVLFLLLIAGSAVFAPIVAPHGVEEIDLGHRLAPPGWASDGMWSHPLGTDGLGRDLLTRGIYGARISLSVGLAVVLLAGAVGTVAGLLAGYMGGWWDTIIMRAADAQLAFPGLLLVIAVVGMIGPSVPVIIMVIALYGWMIYARLVRGLVLQLRENLFVRAAETAGCSTGWIIRRHLVPNLASPLITQTMLEFARVMLVEASLSYLGLGVQPPDASWGLMVAENQQYLSSAWWTVFFPGAMLALTVLALNVVGNAVRSRSDPQHHQFRVAVPGAQRLDAAQGLGAYSPHVDVEGVASADAMTYLGSLSNAESPGARPGVSDAPQGRPRTVSDFTGKVAADELVALSGLSVDFPTPSGVVHAVDNVSLRVKVGETLGLVGESGSGKSISALALVGLVPAPGVVTFDEMRWRGQAVEGQDVVSLRGAGIATVFQDPMSSLNPLMKVGKQVAEVVRKHRQVSRRSQSRAQALELLDLVGIPDPARCYQQMPWQLSGGMAQRVMIACALASDPSLIIADEPTTALDVTIQAQILDLLLDLKREFSVAVLLISHDLGVVATCADRVSVMYDGRIVEQGDAGQIFDSPMHPYTAALHEATPDPRAASSRLVSIPGNPPSGAVGRVTGCPFAPRCAYSTILCETDSPILRDPEGGVPMADGHAASCWHPLVTLRRGNGTSHE